MIDKNDGYKKTQPTLLKRAGILFPSGKPRGKPSGIPAKEAPLFLSCELCFSFIGSSAKNYEPAPTRSESMDDLDKSRNISNA